MEILPFIFSAALIFLLNAVLLYKFEKRVHKRVDEKFGVESNCRWDGLEMMCRLAEYVGGEFVQTREGRWKVIEKKDEENKA